MIPEQERRATSDDDRVVGAGGFPDHLLGNPDHGTMNIDGLLAEGRGPRHLGGGGELSRGRAESLDQSTEQAPWSLFVLLDLVRRQLKTPHDLVKDLSIDQLRS